MIRWNAEDISLCTLEKLAMMSAAGMLSEGSTHLSVSNIAVGPVAFLVMMGECAKSRFRKSGGSSGWSAPRPY
jgi:hypothetical protein